MNGPLHSVKWQPPDEQVIKLNIDGSSFGNPVISGFVGLFRNMHGEWLHGFSRCCDYTTNIAAELTAIATGLKLAWLVGYRNIVCESDSKTMLDLIKDRVDMFHPQATIIQNIHMANAAQDWSITFAHTLHEGNSCADWLAKTRATLEINLITWSSCPTQLAPLLLSDAMGTIHLKV